MIYLAFYLGGLAVTFNEQINESKYDWEFKDYTLFQRMVMGLCVALLWPIRFVCIHFEH